MSRTDLRVAFREDPHSSSDRGPKELFFSDKSRSEGNLQLKTLPRKSKNLRYRY
jgi:hypothetical protein